MFVLHRTWVNLQVQCDRYAYSWSSDLKDFRNHWIHSVRSAYVHPDTNKIMLISTVKRTSSSMLIRLTSYTFYWIRISSWHYPPSLWHWASGQKHKNGRKYKANTFVSKDKQLCILGFSLYLCESLWIKKVWMAILDLLRNQSSGYRLKELMINDKIVTGPSRTKWHSNLLQVFWNDVKKRIDLNFLICGITIHNKTIKGCFDVMRWYYEQIIGSKAVSPFLYICSVVVERDGMVRCNRDGL